MIPIHFFLLAGFSNPSSLFDECLASRPSSFSLHISVDEIAVRHHELGEYDINVGGGNVLVRLRTPETTNAAKSDRSFLLGKGMLVGYDAMSNERLSRPSSDGSVVDQLSQLLGPISVPLSVALDPGSMKAFFAPFRAFKDWRISAGGAVTTITRGSGVDSSTLRFIGPKRLLREVAIRRRDARLKWVFNYQEGGNPTLSIPSNARRVESFIVQPATPKYASKQARLVVDRMLKAYDGLVNGEVDIAATDGQWRLLLGGKRLREEGAGFAWAYDGTILSVLNKRTGTLYRGKSVRVIISEYIVACGGEVDPLILRIIAHRTPYGDVFAPKCEVRFKGGISNGEVNSDIIEVTGPGVRTSLLIRSDNHLLDSLESETVDRSGRTLTSDTRTFKYVRLGVVPPEAEFEIGPGKGSALPLPKVKGLD